MLKIGWAPCAYSRRKTHVCGESGANDAHSAPLSVAGFAYFVKKCKVSNVTKKMTKLAATKQFLFGINKGMQLGLLQAWQADAVHWAAPAKLELWQKGSQNELALDHVAWVIEMMESGDEVFCFYGTLGPFGLTHLLVLVRHLIKVRDSQLLMATLLLAMGIFELTSKHNLKRQCHWQLMKLITCSEDAALQLITAACLNTRSEPKRQSRSASKTAAGAGAPLQAAPITGRTADDSLETKIGTGKGHKVGSWTERTVKVTFANLDVNQAVRLNFEVLTHSTRTDDAHWDARDESIKKVIAPAFKNVFQVPRDDDGALRPRTLDDFKHPMMSIGHTVPQSHRRLLNLVGEPLTSQQPVLEAARACAARLEAEMAAVSPGLLPEHELPADLQGGTGHTAPLPSQSTQCDICGGEFEVEPIICSMCTTSRVDDEPNRVCCSPGCCSIDPISDAPVCMPCFKETERFLAQCDLTQEEGDSDTEANSAGESD